VVGESDAHGANGRKRSNPLFDPVAGMRAMAEIQADGLRAASELLERMLQPDRDASPAPTRSAQRDYTALVDAWAELLQRIADGLARPVESGAMTIPVDSGAVGPPVRLVLEPSEPRERTTTELWLHNGTSAPVGPLVLRCGELTAPDGAVLDDAQVRFDPGEVALLPPRSSRGVLVSLAASGPLCPGIYRGTIQADGAPMLWLPVEATVEAC
jgi:hypothetical protein